jgi:hypothetical protein
VVDPNIFTAKSYADIQTTFETPYLAILDNCPYDDFTHRLINVPKKLTHPTLGLHIQICPKQNLPILIKCLPSTLAKKINGWWSELKQGYITSINDIPTTTINKTISSKESIVKITFSTIEKQAMHPQYGIPQMYHDQMNVIGCHLWEMHSDPIYHKDKTEEIVHPVSTILGASINSLYKKKYGKNNTWHLMKHLPHWYKITAVKKRRKLTRRYLLKQPDWNDWKELEWKQLNQYEAQSTFGKPCQLPKGANLLPLLWTYLIKDCGTKKAWCVCNGSKHMTGSVTLAETYAGSLEQTGSRIFWSAAALYNFITIGADASNAFAGA